MIFREDTALDLICLGRAGVDLNPIEFNRPIEEVTGFIKSVGGSPANIAVGAAKQGVRVGFIGRIADNGLGRYVRQYLEQQGIDTAGILVDTKHSNGLALTQVLDPEHCQAYLYREDAADLNLDCRDIEEAYIASAKVLLISGTALARSPSREAALLAIEYARKHQVKVAMDIDYRAYSWGSQEETSLYYSMACEKCDLIIGTREEYDAVEYLWDHGNQEDRRTAERLLAKGTECVIIKHGSEGSNAYQYVDGTIQETQVGIIPAKVRKTFGAGDAYAAGLLAGLLQQEELSSGMLRGSATASLVIAGTDCTESMPDIQTVRDYVIQYKQQWGEEGTQCSVI